MYMIIAYTHTADYRHQGMELTEAQELLASSQNRLREANGELYYSV